MRLVLSRNAFRCFVAATSGLSAVRALNAGSFSSPSDLVVLQLNNPGSGKSDSVTMYEFNPANLQPLSSTVTSYETPVNQVNLPTNSLSYNGTSGLGLTLPDVGYNDGQITLSEDGHSLSLVTYLNAVGSTPGDASGSSPSLVPRVATLVKPDGSIDDSTQLTVNQDSNDYSNFYGTAARSALTLDGTQFWVTGNGDKPSAEYDVAGLRYATLGASDSLSMNINDDVDLRTAGIYNGQLYAVGGSSNGPLGSGGEHTLYTVGAGLSIGNASSGAGHGATLPTYKIFSAQGTGTFGNGDIQGNQSPAFVTLGNGIELLYESNSTSDTIDKYSLINGVWTGQGTTSVSDGPQDLAVSVSGNTATVYVSTYNNIFKDVDTGGSGAMSGPSTLSDDLSVYGVPNTIAPIRGIAFAPAPSTDAAVENQIWGSLSGTGTTGGSWTTAGNWAENDGVPNANGVTVTFGPALTTSGIVTLGSAETVGHVVFNDTAANYTIAATGSGSLVINNSDPYATGGPSIFNTAGNHTISAPISLGNGVTIANEYQQNLTISSTISGSGVVQIYGPGSLVLSGSSSYAGATVVHSGSVLIPSGGSFPTTTDLTVGDDSDLLAANTAVGATALTTFNASTGTGIRPITLNSLSLTANGTVDLIKPTATGNRSVLVVSGLTFEGTTNAWAGQLDLSGNDMIIHGGNLANVTNQAAMGYNAGHWNGSSGLISSMATADTTHLTALGVIQNNQNGMALYSGSTKFDTVTPLTSDILVKYTYYGDTDLNGIVDGTDYSRIDAAYLADRQNSTASTGWFNGDFNYDGVIDGSDYTLMDNAFNTQGTSLATQIASPEAVETAAIAVASPAISSAVPEPSSIALIGLLGVGLLGRKRRSKISPR